VSEAYLGRVLSGWRSRVTGFRVLLAALLLGIFAFYWWTANTSYYPPQVGPNVEDRYNLLTDGFTHGQLSFRVKPPSGLLALANPYDPDANLVYRQAPGGLAYFHDVSLYKGRFYLYFGLTPVVTLFAPFRVLGLGHMSESLAALVYSYAGLLFALLLLRFLVHRYVPETPRWAKLLASLTLAADGALPFLLRRPTTYEVAISAGFAFLFAALYLFATGALGARLSLRRMALGSLCLGLSIGARPDLVLAVAAPLGLWVYLTRTNRLGGGWSKLKPALALLGPLVACGVLLLVYNKLRFDSFTQFGQRYQLAGVDPATVPSYKLSNFAPGLYFFYLAPARLTRAFPYFHLPPPPNYPGKLPTGTYGLEMTGGLLPNVPVTVGALMLPLLWRRRAIPRELGLIAGALLTIGLITAALIAFANPGVTMRYEVDFATIVLIGALMCWCVALRVARASRVAYTLVTALLVVLALWGILYGVAISFTGYYDTLRVLHPHTYNSLAHYLRPVPTVLFIVLVCAAWRLLGAHNGEDGAARRVDYK
jgi:hypothetical protein